MYDTHYVPLKIQTDYEGYNYLSKLYSDLSNLSKDICINFDKCIFYDGNLSAAMGAIFDKLTDEGFNLSLKKPVNKGVRTVLGRNGFFKAWQVDTGVLEKEYYIEFTRFYADNADKFKQYIDSQLLHKQNFPKHTEKVGTEIVDKIYEIYANAAMHGESNIVICCGDYNEKDSTLHMTIVNCGKTIVENVNSFLRRNGGIELEPCKAIEWAFVEGNTTKSTTGGLGLHLLKEFITQNEGSLEIVSGKGMIKLENGSICDYNLSGCFPGTIVNMNFNFNDKKMYFMASERPEIDINQFL